jgi:hypothetical protein
MRPSNPSRNSRPWFEARRVISYGDMIARRQGAGAPGSMASTDQDFVYADCSLNGRRFEIHVDVEYQGSSGALHEIDVSVCDQAHADAVRRNNSTPKMAGNKLIMAFECKFYESTPGVNLIASAVRPQLRRPHEAAADFGPIRLILVDPPVPHCVCRRL